MPNHHPPHIYRKAVALILVAFLMITPIPPRSQAQALPAITDDTACRFGITSASGSAGYNIASLGVASYLDWGAVTNPSLPSGVEYIRVLRLRDDWYPQTLASLPAWVQANPGGVWIVGDEPDTTFNNQDALLPEVYADRYYQLSQIIRRLDRTAQIGFGPIVQPTPIRIRYLQRAWDRLAADAGGYAAASSLVDFWAIHSFILNEATSLSNYWGTSIPPGFEDDYADAFIIDLANHPEQLSYTYSIDIFQSRIIAFRAWLASIGERNKPLWITEYGSLMPPVDPPGYLVWKVSDADTATYMQQTFNFMLGASDPNTGMPADGDQLVQRWFWFSLNEHRYLYGGTLYNPDYPAYGDPITLVGQDFIAYQASLPQPDLFPQTLTVSPVNYNSDQSLVNYRLSITVDNNQFYDATCAQLSVYDGDPGSGGSLIAGPLPASALKADYGTAKAVAYWLGVEPLTMHELCVVVASIGVADTVPANNQACFSVSLELPKLVTLPAVLR